MRLKDKIVLIPGAARGIGRAIARKMADEGATLILPTLDWPEANQDMEKEFTERGTTFWSVQVDLRDEQQVVTMTEEINNKFGKLHILINNIERGGMPVVHGSYNHPHNQDQWDLEFATTLKAKWLLFQHCLPLMRQAESAAVVTISSIAGLCGRSGAAAPFFNDGYSAANRAVSSFTETWAREAAPDIRVNELMLGLIDSRHGKNTRGWATMTAQERQKVEDHTLLARTGLPTEVANAVIFLALDATYMTGSVIRMDGGYMLGSDSVPDMPPGILINS